MITLHHLEQSRSQRVLWLLEELGLRYELKRYARDPKTMLAPPELTAVHPLGKSPVITEGDITVAESGAILEYLIDSHGDGRLRPPAGTEALRRWRYWMHFAEGSAMPPLLVRLIVQQIRKARLPFFARPVARRIADRIDRGFVEPNLARLFPFLEAELGRGPWFAGDEFSAADIQMSYPVEAAAGRGGLDMRFARVQDWLARIHARPAYQRAVERGGPMSTPG
jgi:glutathione S-transferase